MISRKMAAIEPVVYNKPDSKVEGGFARIAQKVEAAAAILVMDFHDKETDMLWRKGSRVILRGDAGVQPWNKSVLEYKGQRFVLCPADQIIGFEPQ